MNYSNLAEINAEVNVMPYLSDAARYNTTDHELIATLYNAAPVLLDAAEQNARLIALLQGVLVASDAQMEQIREDIAKELKT